LTCLPRLSTRRYSIASCPRKGDDSKRVELAVAVLQETSPTGRPHHGIASNWLQSTKPGDILLASVRPCQKEFHVPADASVPMILVGPGTGLAPLRGFIQERAEMKKAGKSVGETVLFFGCRNPHDYIFREELEQFSRDGVLSNLHVAFSRSDPSKKVYVFHQMDDQADFIWNLLHSKKAVLFVCGDARTMAKDVHSTLVSIVEKCGGRNRDMAEQYVAALREQSRYVEDVWG